MKLNILIFQNYLNLKFNFLLIIIIILKMLNPEENISLFPGLNSPNPILNKYYEQSLANIIYVSIRIPKSITNFPA